MYIKQVYSSTGSTYLKLIVVRDSDDYGYDHNDSTFKASGWTTLEGTFTEPDSTNYPGYYRMDIDVSGWDDGVYSFIVGYNDGGGFEIWGIIEVRVYDGVESTALVESLGTGAQSDLTGVTIDTGMDMGKTLKSILAAIAGDTVESPAGTITVKDQDGNTLLTWVIDESAGTRTVTIS